MRLSKLIILCYLASASISAAAAANSDPAAVAVETAGGRRLQGYVDARSDDQSLWLRQEEGGVVLSTTVGWQDILSATVGADPVSAEELKQRYTALATAAPSWDALEGLTAASHSRPAAARRPSGDCRRAGKPRIQRIEIVVADLANLDADVEPDAIVLQVAAASEANAYVAVRGSLRATLYGERHATTAPGPSFEQLETWTERLRPEDFADGIATFELPLRGTAPEWEFDLAPDAVLTVELGVFGQRNFAASTPIVIRPFNPLRDALQQSTGTRFFPAERRAGRATSEFRTPLGRWMHWTW
jgi:hypothetical protein